MGNADYLAIWHQLLLPLAYEVITHLDTMFHFFYSNRSMHINTKVKYACNLKTRFILFSFNQS